MKRNTMLVMTAALLGALVLAGCSYSATPSGTTGGGTTGGGATSSGSTVSMKNFAFNPSTIDVVVGATVTFTNDDTVQHNVAGESWSSGPLDPGQSYTATFSNAGAIAVKCLIHPSMTMTVNVK